MTTVDEILSEVEDRDREIVKQLLSGPEELQLLIKKCYEHRHFDPPDWLYTEVPNWLYEEVRSLRPLTRKYFVRVLERHGLVLKDNEHTRSLGFYGDWVPVTK